MSLIADAVDLARRSATDTTRAAMRLPRLVTESTLSHPDNLFAVLRTVRPIFTFKDMAIVTRYDDVLEVLTRDEDFGVDAYAGPMKKITGDFILGLNQGPQYERDVSLLRLAFRQDDVPRIKEIATNVADTAVRHGRLSGSLDVVADLCDVVPAQLTADYLGLTDIAHTDLVRWARTLFAEIFTNLTNDPAMTAAAQAAAPVVRSALDALVAERKAELNSGAEPRATVLDRLLQQQDHGIPAFPDAEVRSNLIGLFVGLIPTTSRAAALALDDLLDRPQTWAGLQAARAVDDEATVWSYVTEAMRLAPQAPGLIRIARTDCVIAAGTHHETKIAKGTTVFAAIQSAMLDSSVVDRPSAFRAGRPDTAYLHFGQGLHQCFGRYVNRVSIPAIIGAVASAPSVERASGPAGKLSVDQGFPTSMQLTFAPSATGALGR